MTSLNRFAATVLFAVSCEIAGVAGALAQAPAPAQAAPPPGADQSGPGDQGGGPQESSPQQLPVLAITGIEVIRSSQTPAVDVLHVRGITSTDGWSSPELLPLSHGTPPDGVLDVLMVAEVPPEFDAKGFGQVDAVLPIEPGHPYKAIRVRSASNAVTLKTLPGSTQSKPPADDCSKCVGKYYLAKGATAPAGVAAADIVKQEDLPPTLRIIKPTDGISSLVSNPNRLTLIIGEDGKIVDAAWD